MSTDPVPSLEPWIGALREDVEPMPDTARYRVASRLVSTAMVVAAGTAAPATADLLQRGFLQSRRFAVALALPVGALLGAAGHAEWQRRTTPPVAVVAAPSVSTAAASASVAALAPEMVRPVASESLTVVPAVAPSAKRAPSVAPSVTAEREAPSLERELSLLERARTALSEGEPQRTLRLLGEHGLAYPNSALQQEREALTIRALMAVGRSTEARARAARFVEAYPTSALRASVDRAVSTIP
jgi:hypothetical protein